MRILLAVDNSRPSEEAVRAVASRPWPPGSVIRVLACVPELLPVGLPEAACGAAVVFDQPRRAFLADADWVSSNAARELAAHQLDAHAVVRLGEPMLEIVSEARDWGADLIVVGTHGYTGLKRFLYGSVAQTVVRHAPCSVEVVKRATAETAGGNRLRGFRLLTDADQRPAAA